MLLRDMPNYYTLPKDLLQEWVSGPKKEETTFISSPHFTVKRSRRFQNSFNTASIFSKEAFFSLPPKISFPGMFPPSVYDIVQAVIK